MAGCGGGGGVSNQPTGPVVVITPPVLGDYTGHSNSNSFDLASVILYQNNGTLWLTGFQNCTIVRYDVNGSIDKSFGNNGVLSLPRAQVGGNASECIVKDIKEYSANKYLVLSYQTRTGFISIYNINNDGSFIKTCNTGNSFCQNGFITHELSNENFSNKPFDSGRLITDDFVSSGNKSVSIYGMTYGYPSSTPTLFTAKIKDVGQQTYLYYNEKTQPIPRPRLDISTSNLNSSIKTDYLRTNDGNFLVAGISNVALETYIYNSELIPIISGKKSMVWDSNTNNPFSQAKATFPQSCSFCNTKPIDYSGVESFPSQLLNSSGRSYFHIISLDKILNILKFDYLGNSIISFGVNGVIADTFVNGDFSSVEMGGSNILVVGKTGGTLQAQMYDSITGSKINIKLTGKINIPQDKKIIGLIAKSATTVLVVFENSTANEIGILK